MSYQTSTVLEKHGLTQEELKNLPEEKQQLILIEALQQEDNLGAAWRWVENAVAEFKNGNQRRLIKSEDPNSKLGGKIIRLLAFEVPRKAVESHFGVAVGMYNCCSAILGNTKEDLGISIAEQIAMQSTPDC